MVTLRLSCGSGGKKGSKNKDVDIAEEAEDTTKIKEEAGDKSVNVQQLPKDGTTRACFVPEQGYKLIDADYSDQEGHVFAELSQDQRWIDFYNDPAQRDGHSYVAKLVFPDELKDIPESEVKSKRKDLRNKAKNARFTFNYNGVANTLVRSYGYDKSFADQLFRDYFKIFEGTKRYFVRQKRDMWRRGFILISEYTGLKAYIYDWPILKAISARIENEPDFMDNYWKIKKDSTRSKKVLDEVPASVAQQIYKRFADGWQYKDIIGTYEYFVIKNGRKGKKERVSKTIDINLETIIIKVKSHLDMRIGSSENQSCNYPSQGTSAFISKVAGIRYFNHLCQSGRIFKVKIANFVHDEYLIEAPSEWAEEESKVLKGCMESAAKIAVHSVTLKAEPEIGDCWIH